jgi:hypothetical protein
VIWINLLINMLRVVLCLFFVGLLNFTSYGKVNNDVKQKIFEEITLLQQDLQIADSLVRELQQDNLKMQQNLKAVENWGVIQQEEKEKYYGELLLFENKLDESRRQVDLEKLKQKELADKYAKVKQIFGYICGALFVFLYLTIGAPLVRNLSPAFGIWSPMLSLLSPAIAFGAGYLLIYLIF